jgi:hypothetical protein
LAIMLFRRPLVWLLIILFAAVLVEGGAALTCWLGLGLLQKGGFVWNPDLEQVRKSWNELSAEVDEDIGGIRVSGFKHNSEFADDAQPCGSAYGDSYVYGSEVAEAEGWIEQLSHLLACHVVNYAVGGYGTDQALLRFRRTHDVSPVALLGIDSNSVMDIVNQYDGFLQAGVGPYLLKGRFLLDPNDQLEWLPQPRFDANGFVAMHRDPGAALPQSYFLPDTPDGPITLHFPNSATLAKIARMRRLQNIVARRAEWSDMYATDHPSAALKLMVAISEAFVESAKVQRKRALIVMLPVAGSFREQANYGRFEYAPLVAMLRAKGIDVLDPGPAMVAEVGGRSACDLFTHARPELAVLSSPVPCGGHYSQFANTILARLVAAELRTGSFFGP